MCRALEADFRQYYHADLRDIFDPDSGMTVRWVLDMLIELPVDSRFSKNMRNDPLDVNDGLLLEVINQLNQVFYQTSLSASAAIGKSYKKYMKDAPKPIEHPKIVEEKKEKPKFLTGKELKEKYF